LIPIIFQDVTGNSVFRPKTSDVSTFTFDLTIKWTRVAAENRVGRVTVNRDIFFFCLTEDFEIVIPFIIDLFTIIVVLFCFVCKCLFLMFRIPGKFKGQCEVLHSWSIYHLSCLFHLLRPSWSWSRMVVEFYNYLCNRCLPPLKLWVRTPFMVRCTRYNIMW
jgi:hypothetical protein